MGTIALLVSRLTLASLAFAPALVSCDARAPCDQPGALCLAASDPLEVRVGFRPDALEFVDLDGDGVRDIVAASAAAGTLTAFWGRVGGSTGAATTWSIGQEVAGLVVADLDADGLLDLATALPDADAVAVLRGRGAREFATPAQHAAGAVPRALVAADLDHAGPPELITANLGDGTVSVLRELVADPPTVVGPGPRALASGDLDGDGHLDVAVALADVDAVQVLRGDGHGALWPATLHPVGAAPYAVVVADLDLDGHLDVATADSLDDTVSVLWGEPSGALRRRVALPTVTLPSALVVAQGDDTPPVLGVLSESTSTVERLDPRTGDALLGVSAEDPFALAADGAELVVGGAAVSAMSPGIGMIMTPLWRSDGAYEVWPLDLDGDGTDELLVRDRGTETGTLALRRGPDAAPLVVEVGLQYPREVGSADLTGDLRTDVVVYGEESLVVLVQQIDGGLRPGEVTAVADLRDAVVVDIDADERAEVLLLSTSETGSSVLTFRSDEAGALSLVGELALDLEESPYRLRVIDGDGDATPDLLVHGFGALYYLEDARGPARALALDELAFGADTVITDLDLDGRLDGLYCGLDGAFAVSNLLDPAPPEPARLTGMPCIGLDVFDLDGDGSPELLTYEDARSFDDAGTLVRPWRRSGDVWLPRGPGLLRGAHVWSLVRAQLDGEGAPELLVYNSDEAVAIPLTLGPSLIEAERARLFADPTLRFADIDGDGTGDLVTLGAGPGVALADGQGGFHPVSHAPLAPAPGTLRRISEAALNDFDRDGVDDLVWLERDVRSPVFNLVSATLSAAGVERWQASDLLWGESPGLFPGDLDGDGALDLVVIDAGYGLNVHVLRGLGDGRFDPPVMLDLAIEGHGYNRRGLHDVNRDGHLDLLGGYTALVEGGVLMFPGVGDGSFGAAEKWSDVQSGIWDSERLVFGDFDRDGRVELVMTNYQGALLWAHGGDDPDVRRVLDRVDVIATADLDRDGHPELLAAGNSGDGTTALHVGRGRSDGSFGFTRFDVATTGVRAIEAADIDGDHDLDIALVSRFGATIVRQQP